MLFEPNFDDELEGLQQQYNILCKQINRLGEALIIETDVMVVSKYEEQLKQAQAKRDELNWQISQFRNQQLYPLLLRLDYTDQEQLFSRFIRRHQIAAFLIHGSSPEYGHHWLANRLLKEIRSIKDKPILIDLDSLVYNPDSSIIWKQLGRHFGGRLDSPDAVVDKVLNVWTNQNILIVVDNVEFMTEELLCEFIASFWEPLTERVKSIATDRQSKLLMFLIDNLSYVENQSWNIPFTEVFESTWSYSSPIKLPMLKLFSDTILRNWINNEFLHLPDLLIEDIDQSIQIILDNSDAGVPILALEEICNLCECELRQEWLKIC